MRFLIIRPSILLAAVLASLHLPPCLASAAEPTPSEISVARRLFEEGKAAEDAGRWREGADKFRQAAAIKDTPGIRFHLARCEEEQGAFVEALLEYDRASELIDAGVKAPDVERLLAEARARVRSKVALVTLRLPADVQGASVFIDGKLVSGSVLGVALPINPGQHRVQATAPGRRPFAQALQLKNGESRELSLVLPSTASAPPVTAAPAAASATHTAPSDASVPTRTIVLVGEGSLLAAAIGTGIIFSFARGSANDRFDAANQKVLEQSDRGDPDGIACSPPDPVPGCSELEQARRDRSRAGTAATTSFVVAGASVAALGLTWWLWPAQAKPVEASLSVMPDSAAVSLRGRF